MHAHQQHEHRHPGHPGRRRSPAFPGRGDTSDPFDGVTRGRGGGRSRGRGRADSFGPDFGPGYGRHGGFGPGFGPAMFGRGPKRGRGDVRAAILALLAEEPMHGYQVITEIAERSGGVWHPSPGSVYPTLQVLEDQGLVTADQAAGRRVFSLTDEGRAEAEAAGDGPAPWEQAARGANRSLVDLKSLMGEVAAAAWQVGRTGSEQQVRKVADILGDTRRRIYLVLAEGTTVGDDGGSASEETTSGAG